MTPTPSTSPDAAPARGDQGRYLTAADQGPVAEFYAWHMREFECEVHDKAKRDDGSPRDVHTRCLWDAFQAGRATLQSRLDEAERERDEARGVLASVTDCLNTFARENGAKEENNYLSLAVRDLAERVVFAVQRRATPPTPAPALDEAERKVVEAAERGGPWIQRVESMHWSQANALDNALAMLRAARRKPEPVEEARAVVRQLAKQRDGRWSEGEIRMLTEAVLLLDSAIAAAGSKGAGQ